MIAFSQASARYVGRLRRPGHRTLGLLVALLALALFVWGLPERVAGLEAFVASYQRPIRELGFSPAGYVGFISALDFVIVLAHLAIALLILWRRAGERMALLVALALVSVPLTVTHALAPTLAAGRLLAAMVHFLGLTVSVTLLYLFPDGRFVPRWTRAPALLWAALALPATFLPAAPLSPTRWPSLPLLLLLVALLGSGLYAQRYRYAHVSSAPQREQTRWATIGLAAAALAPFGYFFPFITLPSLGQSPLPTLFYQLAGPGLFTFLLLARLLGFTLFTLLLLLFPLSFAVAIQRYRLWEINLLLNRTLVYGALSASVVTLYIAGVGAMSVLFQVENNLFLSVLVTGLIALLFHPLRQRLQRAANRLMYGERDDPHALLAELGQQMESALSPERLLPSLVETVAHTLKLPYVAVAVQEERAALAGNRAEAAIAAEAGRPLAPILAFPLVYQGEMVGQLLVGAREGEEELHPSDRRLLETVAHQAGAAVYALRLTGALQRSREQLVVAREEERRHLRRELHDGLGPQLASLTLKLEAARNLLARDPDAVARLLSELKIQSQEALAAVRQVSYDLRPPALDQLGLLPALRERAAAHSQTDGLHITVEAPDSLPPLPAAVEVAAYRIALEALTNAERHAHARHCTLRLALDGALCLEISDDGVGLPDPFQAGVGMASMRERAAELGGSWAIERRAAGGTRVAARLPLPREWVSG